MAALSIVPLFAQVADAKTKDEGVKVKVMSRNVFLGADLGPALRSTGFESFIEANGAILREVDLTNFPLRAQGLAGEIAERKPDLVGLQEVAMWRTGPAAIPPAVSGGPFGAVTVEYDFLQLLLDQLSARGLSYTPAVVKEEFDFEAPADENNVDNDAPPVFNPDPATNDESAGSLDDAELNGRLTMRDVILVNDESKVKAKLKNPQVGTFSSLYTPDRLGDPDRGDPRLDRRRRDGQDRRGQPAAEAEVSLRQQPLRGVRRRDPAAEHPRPAGRRAGRRAGERRQGDPARRLQLERAGRPAGRRAGVPDAARRRLQAQGRRRIR